MARAPRRVRALESAPWSSSASGFLGAAQIREIAARLGLRPTKQWGQNFVVDANTVKRIVRLAGVGRRRRRGRGRPRARVAHPRAAARGRARHRGRGGPDPRAGAAGHREPARTGIRRPADARAGRRDAGARAARPASPRRSSRTCPTTSRCPWC